jgi:hypothetical protein
MIDAGPTLGKHCFKILVTEEAGAADGSVGAEAKILISNDPSKIFLEYHNTVL